MTQLYDVIIAGGGPVGLFLACELGLRGISVLVLERDPKPEKPSAWKIDPLGRRGLITIALEHLNRRGLLTKFFDPFKRPSYFPKMPGKAFGGHFAGMVLNANQFDKTRWPYRLPGPAIQPGPTSIETCEQVFAERAEQLGAKILRGTAVTTIVSQDDNSVTVTAENGESKEKQDFRGKWLVGADGGRSVIRKAAEFNFVGTEARITGFAVSCEWEPKALLPMGFHLSKTGMYVGAEPNMLYLIAFDQEDWDREREITLEHLQKVLTNITGNPEIKMTKIHLATSFTDRSKQVTEYRRGRILLAGDAAHIHSPLGFQGLNVGMSDAMNLGWKLSHTIQQEAKLDGAPVDLTLLDSYRTEQHPIAAWVLDWTRAQVMTLQPDMYGNAIQALVKELIETDDGANHFLARSWGLSQRFVLGDGTEFAHPLIGVSAPDFELSDGTRLGPRQESGKALLVDFENVAALKGLVVGQKYEARVDYLNLGAKNRCSLRALLVRPDGIVAWLTEDNNEYDMDTLKAALERWFPF